MSTLKDRVAQAEEFLSELGRGIPDNERVMVGYADEATVQTDETGKKQNAGWWPAPWKMGKPLRPNANCYACISSSIKTPNPKTGEMRYWRGETSFGHGLALMVDDVGSGKGSKGAFTIDQFARILLPTVVVETSPKNYQLWYFLSTPADSLPLFKAFIRCFVAAVLKDGGDHTIKDISRYGRMPLGINNKRVSSGVGGAYKYADAETGKPWVVRLVEADYSRRYSMEEIARAFCFKIEVPMKRLVAQIDELAYAIDYVHMKMAEQICNEAQMGEGAGGAVSENASGKFRIQCPWGDEHANGDVFGAYFRGPLDGTDVDFVFGCGHDTCRRVHRRTWSSFVEKIVMPVIEGDLETTNKQWAGLA